MQLTGKKKYKYPMPYTGIQYILWHVDFFCLFYNIPVYIHDKFLTVQCCLKEDGFPFSIWFLSVFLPHALSGSLALPLATVLKRSWGPCFSKCGLATSKGLWCTISMESLTAVLFFSPFFFFQIYNSGGVYYQLGSRLLWLLKMKIY